MGFISSLFEKENKLTPLQQWEQINKKYADNPIERIREKLILVAIVDHEHKEFGANSHNYQLNPPLSIEKADQLQKKSWM
ncbi:hypothetical protein [Proteus sp. NMG38-2]|uniref:hypothetical protein n=1 Tax=Proteus sp. NMG38-2 TaxID=2883107 RepID=UPI001D0BADD2|nr:hypothetical protein [Proteus sp. NMG38-2]UDN37398.1 hypothetical protein LG402_07070 [Proteus sp. NMG38-2]